MTGDWRVLKIRRLRELEFHSAEEADIEAAMNGSTGDGENDEKPRGMRPWDAVRASKVARARELVKNPDYPSKKVVNSVAELLARNLASSRRAKK